MSAETLYEHLSILEQSIATLEELVVAQEDEIADLNVKLANAELAAVNARRDVEDLANRVNRDAQKYIESEVRSRVEATLSAERQMMKDELEKARAQVAEANKKAKTKKSSDPQIDLFGQAWGAPSQPSKVANDQSALLLAGKLDFTIDKVQRLIREATA